MLDKMSALEELQIAVDQVGEQIKCGEYDSSLVQQELIQIVGLAVQLSDAVSLEE